MTVPPDEPDTPPAGPGPDDGPLDFDPYRFGKPDYPIAPEYAPPGYVPPAPPPSPLPPPPPMQVYPPGRVPYGHPYPPGYEPQTSSNTKAVISLVLGILAIVLFWAAAWDLLLVVPAILFGAIARVEARRDPRRGGRGMATSGLVCGIVALVLSVSTIYIYHRIQPCLDRYGASSSSFQTCAKDRLFGND